MGGGRWRWMARLIDFQVNETALIAAGGNAGCHPLHGTVVAEDLLAHARAAPASRGERLAPLHGMGEMRLSEAFFAADAARK